MRENQSISVPARTLVVLERIGRGGSAEVFKARMVGAPGERIVCIKRPLTMDADVRRGFVEEARLLAAVRHPNVVDLLDLIEDVDGAPVLVLEHVEGLDLRELGKAVAAVGESLPPSIVATVGAAICRALGAAGRAVVGGLVHRDVSPHNVLVSNEGHIKLADFGVARAFDRERWTAARHVKGKRGYFAPEVLRGEVPDARSDLYAVGVVMYELLAGARPFPDDRAGASGPPPLAEMGFDVPRVLQDVVTRLLSHEPAARPSTPDLAARLLALASEGEADVAHLGALVRRVRSPGVVRVARRGSERDGPPHAGRARGLSDHV